MRAGNHANRASIALRAAVHREPKSQKILAPRIIASILMPGVVETLVRRQLDDQVHRQEMQIGLVESRHCGNFVKDPRRTDQLISGSTRPDRLARLINERMVLSLALQN